MPISAHNVLTNNCACDLAQNSEKRASSANERVGDEKFPAVLEGVMKSFFGVDLVLNPTNMPARHECDIGRK